MVSQGCRYLARKLIHSLAPPRKPPTVTWDLYNSLPVSSSLPACESAQLFRQGLAFWRLRKPSQRTARAADALSRVLASQTTTHPCNLVSLWKVIFSLKIKKMDFSLHEGNTFKIGKNVCVLFKLIVWSESEEKRYYKPPFCRWWASPYIIKLNHPLLSSESRRAI